MTRTERRNEPEWVIYHNPRCGKSRKALEALEEREIEPRVILYLKDPPTRSQLIDLLRKLGMRPGQLARTKEPVFRELDLDSEEDEAVLRAMLKHPILIERPIVVHGDRAVVARPVERIKELYSDH